MSEEDAKTRLDAIQRNIEEMREELQRRLPVEIEELKRIAGSNGAINYHLQRSVRYGPIVVHYEIPSPTAMASIQPSMTRLVDELAGMPNEDMSVDAVLKKGRANAEKGVEIMASFIRRVEGWLHDGRSWSELEHEERKHVIQIWLQKFPGMTGDIHNRIITPAIVERSELIK